MELDELVAKYRTKGVVVDTNLLLLLAVGIYRRDRIQTFNRTRQYTVDDFDLLVRIVDLFHKRIVTPNVVTEADNLARQLPTQEHGAVAAVMTSLISASFEVYSPSKEAVSHKSYPQVGVTDCTILAAGHEALVITDDLRLWGMLSALGHDAININHIRAFGWT
jgi:hypothetical protein